MNILLFTLLVGGMVFIHSAKAATLTWDASSTAGIQEGSGTWDTSSNFWTTNGGASTTNWIAFSNAVFGGGSSGTAGTVSLSGTQFVNSLNALLGVEGGVDIGRDFVGWRRKGVSGNNPEGKTADTHSA